MKRIVQFFSCLVFLISYSSASFAVQQTKLVEPACFQSDQGSIAYKGLAYFCSDREGYGQEVHVSDGSEFGTRILKDIDPGPGSSSPFGFFEYKGALFFIAETTATGTALWKTDGTEKGTVLVKTLYQDSINDNLIRFLVAGETSQGLYFEISTRTELNGQLFQVDSNSLDVSEIEGVAIVDGVYEETTYTVFNDELFIMTYSVLYRLSASGIVSEIGSFPNNLFEVFAYISPHHTEDNGFWISGPPVGDDSNTLWFSDGTADGTVPYFDKGNWVTLYDEIDGKLIYRGDSGVNKLYSSADGVNENLLIELDDNFAILQHNRYDLRFNGSVVLRVDDYDSADSFAIISDGTVQGTIQLPFTTRRANDLLTFNGQFFGYDDDGIWLSDGTIEGSREVFAGNGVRIVEIIGVTTEAAYILTFNFDSSENEIWKLNLNNQLVKIASGIFYRGGSFTEGQRLFVSRQNLQHLWHTDGTSQGTYTLKYIFDDGLPEPEPIDFNMVPLIFMLLDEEEQKIQK